MAWEKDRGMNKEEMQNFGFQPVEIEIPKQEEFYKLPRRFGSVPVDEVPHERETVIKPATVKNLRVPSSVIPAEAGIQKPLILLDSRLRGNDKSDVEDITLKSFKINKLK